MKKNDFMSDAVHGRSATESIEKGAMSNAQANDWNELDKIGFDVELTVWQLKHNGVAHFCYTKPLKDGNVSVCKQFPTNATKEEFEQLKKAMGDVELFCNPFYVATRDYVLSLAKEVVMADPCFFVSDIENEDELLGVADCDNGWMKAEQWFAENGFNNKD